MTEIRDELLERVIHELQTLPPVEDVTIGEVVRAVVADAETRPTERGRRPGSWRWWRSSVPLAAAAGLAVAAGLGGFLVGGARRGSAPTGAAASEADSGSMTLVSAARPSALRPLSTLVPTQFVLDAPRASRVALVGDFNMWSPDATPLARVSSGIWTVSVPLAPGRHTYAFMIDGKNWTLDPRAPTAQDPDFGTPSSVILVGTP